MERHVERAHAKAMPDMRGGGRGLSWPLCMPDYVVGRHRQGQDGFQPNPVMKKIGLGLEVGLQSGLSGRADAVTSAHRCRLGADVVSMA